MFEVALLSRMSAFYFSVFVFLTLINIQTPQHVYIQAEGTQFFVSKPFHGTCKAVSGETADRKAKAESSQTTCNWRFTTYSSV